MKSDVIIIGSGLIGSMAAKYLRKQGLVVLIIDSKEPMAASKCSFGIWKDGWIGDKIKEQALNGMDLLEEVCNGIYEEKFIDMKKGVELIMSRVDCKLIIEQPDIPAKVLMIKNKDVLVEIDGEEFTLTADKAVIIAAGAYTDMILKASEYKIRHIDRYWGATLNVNMNIEESRIKEWAPYKQSVLLKTNYTGFVFGDGASVKNPKMDDKRIEFVSDRLIVHMNEVAGANIPNDRITAVNEGWRPYLSKDEIEHVKQHDKNLFSATGGAKNTTILCGHIAKQIHSKLVAMK